MHQDTNRGPYYHKTVLDYGIKQRSNMNEMITLIHARKAWKHKYFFTGFLNWFTGTLNTESNINHSNTLTALWAELYTLWSPQPP